jgi:protein TonB
LAQIQSNRAIWTTTGAVVALHAAAIAAILLARKPEPIKVTPPRVVTATLISPAPAPAPAPAPTTAPPTPVEPPKPQVHKTSPKVVHRPTPIPKPKPTPTPTPIPAAEQPMPPVTAAPAMPSPPTPAPALAPAVNPNVPKDVRHLTCAATPPEYPALARRRGETGTVVIQFIVDTHGNVESARVKKSSGFDRLDDAARAAALASPCTPYMEDGQAVKAITERPYRFSLIN